jgi:hypothetical protein
MSFSIKVTHDSIYSVIANSEPAVSQPVQQPEYNQYSGQYSSYLPDNTQASQPVPSENKPTLAQGFSMRDTGSPSDWM